MLQTVIYQSDSVRALSDGSLAGLVRTARRRNHGAGVTGALLSDRGRFFQWLEGPAEHLDSILRSIGRDRRHANVEILRTTEDGRRVFQGWDLLLGEADNVSADDGDRIVIPHDLLSAMHQSGSAVPELMPRVAALAAEAKAAKARSDARLLRDLLEHEVIPAVHALRSGAGLDFRAPILALHAEELARALIGIDGARALAMIGELCADVSRSAAPFIALFEPTSRMLGDMWQRSECTELDVAIALSRMQHALRLHCVDRLPEQTAQDWSPEVLVVPQPGARQHYLSAALDSEALSQAGWHVNTHVPDSVEELERIISERWFDALDLTLSAAFEQQEWLPTVHQTILRARAASANPDLAVVVSGRIFHEYAEAGRRVTADSAIYSSGDISEEIVAALPSALRDRFRRRRPARRPRSAPETDQN